MILVLEPDVSSTYTVSPFETEPYVALPELRLYVVHPDFAVIVTAVLEVALLIPVNTEAGTYLCFLPFEVG